MVIGLCLCEQTAGRAREMMHKGIPVMVFLVTVIRSSSSVSALTLLREVIQETAHLEVLQRESLIVGTRFALGIPTLTRQPTFPILFLSVTKEAIP